MRKSILYLVTADLFVPLYYHLSKYLEGCGFSSVFMTFSLREQLLLKKNTLRVMPDNIFSIHNYPIKNNLFSRQELDDILNFTMLKFGGHRKDCEQRILRVASFIEDTLEKNWFEAALVWNGEDLLLKALIKLLKRRKTKIVFAENGYFPKTLQFDRMGVNVNSSITQLPFAQIVESLTDSGEHSEELIESDFKLAQFKALNVCEYIYCFLTRKCNPFYYSHFPEKRGNSWFKEQWLKLKRSYLPLDKDILPDKFIFIPFQVHDDTQIMLNSKFFRNMEDFFEFSYKAIKKNFRNEYKIIVKEHPEDLCRYSYSRLRSKYSDVLWLRKYNIDLLLEKASYVFVINSSIGLQALQKLKPTIVFGESFYARDEVVFRVNDLALIDGVIARAKEGLTETRKKNIAQFINFLKKQYFVCDGWKDVTENGVVNAGIKIISLLNKNLAENTNVAQDSG